MMLAHVMLTVTGVSSSATVELLSLSAYILSNILSVYYAKWQATKILQYIAGITTHLQDQAITLLPHGLSTKLVPTCLDK